MGCHARLIKGTYGHPSVVIAAGDEIKTDPLHMNTSTRMDQNEVLRVKLAVLKREHRDLDEAIEALHERGSADMLTIKRLKKQKLALKDQIKVLEDRILPDIIA